MLILTRRVGGTIIIETLTGERIQVTVLGINGNQVQISDKFSDNGNDSPGTANRRIID